MQMKAHFTDKINFILKKNKLNIYENCTLNAFKCILY